MNQQNISNLCFSDDDSDVKLVFETEEWGASLTVPVHSLVVKRTSAVLRNMLESKEKSEKQPNVLEIKFSGDVSVGLYFVKYLYTKELPNLETDLYVLLVKMARLYQVSGLTALCEDRLWQTVDPFSICRLYQKLENFASEYFLNRCMKVMLHCAFLIFMHKRHLTLHERTMKYLLQSDHLNVLNEEQALTALWQWGLVRCIQENKPGNINTAGTIIGLMPYVRWGLIANNDADSPWFNLAVHQKILCKNRQARNGSSSFSRNPSVAIRLNPFATELKFDANSERSQMIFRREETCELLFFTSSSDIVISGFTFVVGMRKPHSWKDSFRFQVNNVDVNDRLSSKVFPRDYYQFEQTNSTVFIYNIEVEFVNPIVLQKTRFNVLDININEKRNVAFPHFILHSDHFPLSSNDVHNVLSVKKRVSALTSLFYFVKM